KALNSGEYVTQPQRAHDAFRKREAMEQFLNHTVIQVVRMLSLVQVDEDPQRQRFFPGLITFCRPACLVSAPDITSVFDHESRLFPPGYAPARLCGYTAHHWTCLPAR
ncbi:unnamed protein product, partial [Pleuronectes platessa]